MNAKRDPTAMAELFSVILLVAVLCLAFLLAGYFRIDTEHDLVLARVLDVVLGLMIAGAMLLRTDIRWRSTRFGMAAVACVVISGGLLFWHEIQVRMLSTWSHRAIARNDIQFTRHAVADYARDCGQLPPEANGLEALVTNLGVAGWAGPYLEAESLIDPWGTPLQYAIRNGKAEVWSSGPDRQSGTPDDIHWPVAEKEE